MKQRAIAAALLASGLFVTSQAQLIPFFSRPKAAAKEVVSHWPNQKPMADHNAPGIQLPPSSGDDNKNKDDQRPSGDVILSDILGNTRQITIFAGFTRDIDSVSKRLDTASLNATVLAPLNSAISDLPRKPWEDPRDYAQLGANVYDGQDGEDRANRNLRRFTESHIVPTSPWKEGEKVKSVGGGTLWWEMKDGRAVVQPGEVEVDRVANKVANGEVWVLKGVLNYAV